MLRGRTVSPNLRCIIIPGTQDIHLRAMREGLAEVFVEAGPSLAPPCGPCLGGHMGILAAGERCVSTTNRNFVGRMVTPPVSLLGQPGCGGSNRRARAHRWPAGAGAVRELRAWFRCIRGCEGEYPLEQVLYHCPKCGGLLEVAHDLNAL